MATDGLGGTYFLVDDAGRKIAVFKPCDEELQAPNNPRARVHAGLQLGELDEESSMHVGEGGMREVAAYLLDYGRWASVPATAFIRARHPRFYYKAMLPSAHPSAFNLDDLLMEQSADGQLPSLSPLLAVEPLPMKLGSLQEFVANEGDSDSMSSSRYAIGGVHRIGVLDLRLCNTDRHSGNMLVRSSRLPLAGNLTSAVSVHELVPIDHGFCLPEKLKAIFFEWMHWEQAMTPFSKEELD